MANLSDMRDEIKDNLTIRGTSKDTMIGRYIRAAIRQNQRKRLWFLRTIGTVAVASTDTSVSLPSDLSLIESVDLLTSSSRYTHGRGFDLLEYDRLRQQYFNTATLATERPQACAQVGTTLYLSHTSDAAYTLSVTYFKRDASLPTADTDTSVWFDDGYDAIRSLAQHLFAKEHMATKDSDAEIPRGYMAMLMAQHERFEQGMY